MALIDNNLIRQDLAEHLPLAELSEDDREGLFDTLTEHVLSKINLTILEQMQESERTELLSLCDKGDDSAVLNYITQTIGVLDPLVKESVSAVVSQFKVKLYGTH